MPASIVRRMVEVALLAIFLLPGLASAGSIVFTALSVDNSSSGSGLTAVLGNGSMGDQSIALSFPGSSAPINGTTDTVSFTIKDSDPNDTGGIALSPNIFSTSAFKSMSSGTVDLTLTIGTQSATDLGYDGSSGFTFTPPVGGWTNVTSAINGTFSIKYNSVTFPSTPVSQNTLAFR